ncbi:trehalose-phosphatase [Haematomicrobium sanguinis]|uniref:trehalose-phosphatase n=1 Tax=Haematomicrobium sanguinis TaxID=479106 RepID=UPI00047A89EE|nr:trehalose-phosphatase [Haematomicrobium sanguinis]
MSPELSAALDRFARTGTILVALDFDGVMAPIVQRPEDARPLEQTAVAFAALGSLRSTTTALVSGRALASLRSVASPDKHTLLVGSHGAEFWWGPSNIQPPIELSPEQSEALNAAQAALAQVSTRFPGTRVERKPVGVVIHTRELSETEDAAATRAALEALERIPGTHVTLGKRVVEVSVLQVDKGQALDILREATGADAVFFAGDDVTDENGFAALDPARGDVGVKVGAGDTRAEFRIAGPEELPGVLQAIAAARQNVAY